MGASSYRMLDAANFTTVGGFLQPYGFLNISRSRGGFQAAFPLYHMNRHNNRRRKKTKTETKPKQEIHMQTKQSVINSNNHQPSAACREKDRKSTRLNSSHVR